MDYKSILQDAIDFRDQFALIKICLNIKKQDNYFISVNSEIITILGIGNEDLMIEAFEDCELNEYFNNEGIYYADVLLNFINSDETQPSYYVIEAMENIVSGACSGCDGKFQFEDECLICMSTDVDGFDFLNRI